MLEGFRLGAFQRDLHREQFTLLNRLRSIDDDAAFVEDFAETMHPGLAVFGNLRQGVWYTPPGAARCYFKSTDGHHGAWKFNMNRTNLHVALAAARCAGAVIVDATRRGKRFPDSQTRTIPIWSCVINRCVQRLQDRPHWDTRLHLPASIPPSERHQIESIIDAFVDDLCRSSADLDALTLLDRPLRPIWVDRCSSSGSMPEGIDPFLPIICLSCSRSEADVEQNARRGWHYIQGAADDEENWAGPVTADIFAANRAKFRAATTSSECCEMARALQQVDRACVQILDAGIVIAATAADDVAPSIVITSERRSSPDCLHVDIVDSKTDKRSLERALPHVIAFYGALVTNRLASGVQERLTIVGDGRLGAVLATAIVATFFDLDANPIRLRRRENDASHVNKTLLRRSLQVVQRWAPDLFPSRLLMQQLNRFFIRPR